MPIPDFTKIASGPVIIENGRVLLDRELKAGVETLWLFPGGGVEAYDVSLEDACRREVKEELGIEIKIIKQLKTTYKQLGNITIVLNHFLAERIGEIKPGYNIIEWGWHDINNLPKNCENNIYEIIAEYKNMT